MAPVPAWPSCGIFARTVRSRFLALHQADWLTAKLTGKFGISDENNALKMGYDPLQRCWPDWLSQLDLNTDYLPQVVAPGTILGPIRHELADRWGWPATACVVAGTTDSTAGFIATGATQSGTAVTSLGSTLVVKVLSDNRCSLHATASTVTGWVTAGWSAALPMPVATVLEIFRACDIHRYSRLLRPDLPTGLDYYPAAGTRRTLSRPDPALPPRLKPRPESRMRYSFRPFWKDWRGSKNVAIACLPNWARPTRNGY